MNGQKKWADDYARRICGEELKPEPNLNAYVPSYMSDAYLAGFRDALEKASRLVESFENPKFSGVPHLIRAIGMAELCQHNEGVSVCEQEPCRSQNA